MNALNYILQNYRTIKHLKLSQVITRVQYKVKSLYYISPFYPYLEDRITSPHNLLVTPPNLWKGNKKQADKIVHKKTFSFINQEINFGDDVKWYPQGATALWIYNLHYFNWINDLRTHAEKGQTTAQSLVESWLLNCNHFNKISWHPYPLSIRVINWLSHYHYISENMDPGMKELFNQSLLRQCEHLSQNLEWDVEGNHLIKNLKAMVYIGLCLPGQQTTYLEALNLLLDQLKIQIHEDGGHYEKSPSYHVDVLVDLLDLTALIRKAGQTPPIALIETIDRMALAFDFYRYKDKGLALFNDGSVGNTNFLDEVWKRCRMIDSRPKQLPNTGYVRLEHHDTMLMVDVGKCCPDFLPAHAHADTASFEMCLGDERVFVNSGTYAYQHKKRNVFRSTGAHNTVSINGESSAEIWQTFRVGRRPQNVHFTFKEEEKVGTGVEVSHDGYAHLNASHSRKIFLSEDGNDIRGEDVIHCKKGFKTLAHFHLHPETKCKILNSEEAEITTAKGKRLAFKIAGGRLYDAGSEYAPHFGICETGKQLVIKGNYRQNICTIKWAIKILQD
ncbi:MAG: hypothetical protein CMF60_06315 [Magnetococcales bacterium]|nr:hypothetical protein [Magnetococcales bacterium]|tara:strand:+ start:10268 stop:11944 length:1677 start_codon:yes stop_codon:yes gene_type:complete